MPDWKQHVREHLPALGVSGAREHEIVEELAQQLEQAYNDALAAGSTPAQATARASAQFVDWQALAAEIRRAERRVAESIERHEPDTWNFAVNEQQLRKRRGGNMIGDFLQDVRYAFRMLRKNPGFTALVVLTLALGIGANSTIFSVVDAVLLRPLPYPQSDRLMNVLESNPKNGWPRFSASPANFLDWRNQSRSFEKLFAIGQDESNVTVGDFPEHWVGVAATPGFFEALRVRPQLGRVFADDDFVAGKSDVLVLSDALWRGKFGADPNVIGRNIAMDGKPYTIIGVMPRGFQFDSPNKMYWLPFPFSTSLAAARGAHFLDVVGRLRDGVTPAQAQAEMIGIAANLEKQYPDTNKDWSAIVEPLQSTGVRSVYAALLVLLGAVGFVLLIACANAANMLLARATVRRREIAIRVALGAGKVRIVRQLLTESVLLALCGGATGLAITFWSTRALAALPPALLPRAASIHVDTRVLLFTFVLALMTGVVFGMAPALAILRGDLANTLKEAGRSGSGRSRLRKVLVVAEVALAFVLLAGSGLMVRSFERLTAVEPGFNTGGKLAFDMQLPSARYKTPEQRILFFRQAKERLQALPGVTSVTMTSLVPLSGELSLWTFGINGQQNSTSLPSALYYEVDPDYFHDMGIPLIEGRNFTESDNASSPHVCIINDFFARTMFPGRDPIGQHIQIGNNYSIAREVVGVVGSVKQAGLDDKETYQIYEAYAQLPRSGTTLIVQTASEPMAMLPAVRHAIQQVDPQEPVAKPRTLEQAASEAVALPRFRTLLLGLFGALAVVLALVGLYGVMSYTVTQQTQEIGIRMALGAQQQNIYGLIVLRGMALVGIGVGIGVVASLAMTRLLATFLFGVTPHDPATLASVILLFAVVATIACWIPARRASQVDPLVALRHE
jgi:putative ABC transport system permease protein